MDESLTPPKSGDPLRAADKPVGMVFMILGAGSVVAVLLLQAFVMEILKSFVQPHGFQPLPGGGGLRGYYEEPSSLIITSLFAVAMAFCVALFATGFGIHSSQAWGFNLGIVICGLLTVGTSGFAAFGLAGAVYCVLGRVAIARSTHA
jgi:hypothetical protein